MAMSTTPTATPAPMAIPAMVRRPVALSSLSLLLLLLDEEALPDVEEEEVAAAAAAAVEVGAEDGSEAKELAFGLAVTVNVDVGAARSEGAMVVVGGTFKSLADQVCGLAVGTLVTAKKGELDVAVGWDWSTSTKWQINGLILLTTFMRTACEPVDETLTLLSDHERMLAWMHVCFRCREVRTLRGLELSLAFTQKPQVRLVVW